MSRPRWANNPLRSTQFSFPSFRHNGLLLSTAFSRAGLSQAVALRGTDKIDLTGGLMSSEPPRQRRYRPTTEEIAAKRAERLRKKAEKEEKLTVAAPSSRSIIERPWLTIPSDIVTGTNGSLQVKIFTWNLLAQCLVRRELFPNSDCLKAAQREKMLQDELVFPDADILCLQEVDRLEKVLPILDRAGYAHRYAAGRGKKHGCIIAFKRKLFEQVHERLVYYDEQPVRDGQDKRARCGHSFQTRNIGLMLALRFRDDPNNGVNIATTHLFWHPKYTYERARQAGILVREVLDFQISQHWPCFIAGDFNCPPNDAAYALITGQPLDAQQKDCLASSRVTHVSVDPSVPKTSSGPAEDGKEGDEESDPDRVITNARAAVHEDGLLDDDELLSLFAHGRRLSSAYDDGLSKVQDTKIECFGSRVAIPLTQLGFHEPSYTSYTHYWKSVLDYIFFIPPQDQTCAVTGLLAPHETRNFGSGLPLKGICASDHTSLAAEFAWTRKVARSMVKRE